MPRYIMSLDQGTTSSRCILFDNKGQIASMAQKEFKQLYPFPGWVEHDPMEIWSNQAGAAQEAMYKIGATYEDIAGIGITNQRETTILWDKNTGRPVYNAIVWQCRRTAPYCDELKAQGLSSVFHSKTGLPIDAYFSATKIRWILENVPGARQKANQGELLFGTVDTWLIWNLTKGAIHVTDYSNASRTMLFNIHTLKWDEELLEQLDIPFQILPKVCPSSHVYGYTAPSVFGGPIPIAGAAGDQQAALFGQQCLTPGSAKNTYGTGCFLLMNTGDKPVISQNGLLTTIAWGIDKQVTYALEGSIFVGGAAIQWLRDELRMIDTAAESASLAQSVADTNGVYMVPAFVGLGAPYWDAYCRGALFGLTRGVKRPHIVRAALEAIAYQTCDVLHAMEEDSHIRLKALRADGGASANPFLMQFQSDMINAPVLCQKNTEITALGAAYLAGLAIGFWEDIHALHAIPQEDISYFPATTENARKQRLSGWHDAVKRTLTEKR